MANLKDLRSRIKSVNSTKKITAAMKMISAAKLKKAQDAAESSRPYAKYMGSIMSDLVTSQKSPDTAPALLTGTGENKKHLLVVITSNRGLCGGFNSGLVRHVKRHIADFQNQQKKVYLMIVGKKGFDLMRQDYGPMVVAKHLSITNPRFFNAESIANDIVHRFDQKEFDICTVFYNKFISALSQEATEQQLIPFQTATVAGLDKTSSKPDENDPSDDSSSSGLSVYEYEPSQEAVLDSLLLKNIKVQIFSALLESTASEHGARMAAMDGATRNADDLIGSLNLTYNRTRQSVITNELIEIISGAEAL